MASKGSARQVERALSGRTVMEYTYDDHWRGRMRTLRYVGDCYVCSRRTWEADDGENDPRGILGDHATHALIAAEYGRTGPDVALCAICGNDYDAYHVALTYAEHVAWRYVAA